MNENIVKAAVKLLTIRSYSRLELEQKLLNQGYDKDATGEAVEYLTKRGYLNDAALCDILLEKYLEGGKYSLKETYLRLRRRGLGAALINEKITNVNVDAEYQAALKIAMKYVSKEEPQNLHKIIRRLSAKGFKSTTVSKVLAQLQDMSP